MKRTLDILVPHYNEDESVVSQLLDSLKIQQNVDFDELGVIICNDGPDALHLDDEWLESYPFVIEQYDCEKGGVSATRNACLDHSKADYVQFADADDMFFNVCGLFIIFREIENGGFETLISNFTEETRNQETNEIVYINHDQLDMTFVHGKVHNRRFLIKNKIRWNPNLTIHEDSYFNCLCKCLADPNKAKWCSTSFYLWKWRDESVCRHSPLYLNETFINMLESNTALVNEFLKRKRKDSAEEFATSMIFDTYYSLNCDRWWNEEGHPYLLKTELRFKKYWDDFKYLFNDISDKKKNEIIAGQKNRFFQEGMFLEKITFDDWIKHIEGLQDIE